DGAGQERTARQLPVEVTPPRSGQGLLPVPILFPILPIFLAIPWLLGILLGGFTSQLVDHLPLMSGDDRPCTPPSSTTSSPTNCLPSRPVGGVIASNSTSGRLSSSPR